MECGVQYCLLQAFLLPHNKHIPRPVAEPGEEPVPTARALKTKQAGLLRQLEFSLQKHY
jgi:hypothetical protein